jgi:hypothetical protein
MSKNVSLMKKQNIITSIDAFSIVLPLKINGSKGNDLFRLTNILLPSLLKYLDVRQIHDFIVVVPDNECSQVQDSLAQFASRLSIRVIPETDVLKQIPGWNLHRCLTLLSRIRRKINTVCPTLLWRLFGRNQRKANWFELGGWYKQQLLKLFVAKLVKTPFYLTCDADLCLTREANCTVLFPGGKALIELEIISNHPEWWSSSAAMLDSQFRLQPSDTGMSVTPAILSSKVVNSLLLHLEQKAREKKYLTIFDYMVNNSGWTEYTLYWLHLLNFHKPDDFYYFSEDTEHISLFDIRNSLWLESQLLQQGSLKNKITSAFGNKNSLFLVVQSNSVAAKDYLDAVWEFLQ